MHAPEMCDDAALHLHTQPQKDLAALAMQVAKLTVENARFKKEKKDLESAIDELANKNAALAEENRSLVTERDMLFALYETTTHVPLANRLLEGG